jgi:integrase
LEEISALAHSYRSALKSILAVGYHRSLRYAMRAGLPRIRFHDLRHTAAALLLRRGVNPKIVSEMLGHSSVAITLDIYSHVVPDMQHLAADAMDETLQQHLDP